MKDFRNPPAAIVESLQARYAPGTRVRLSWMEDRYAPPAGSLGTVIAVDSLGTIHVSWDCGSSLGVAYGVDRCGVIRCRCCCR